jgi:type II secretory pathway component GspD/PulD (secretin)
MNPIQTCIFLASLSVGSSLFAAEPVSTAPAKPEPNTPPSAVSPVPTQSSATPAPVQKPTPPTNGQAPADKNNHTATAPEIENGTNTLLMNFHAASLDLVLDHLSKAGGFVVNIKPGTSVKGKVDIWSNDPLTRDEALNLLDTVLKQNGLAAIRNGKTLTIVNLDEAKTQNIPVVQYRDPEKIPISDKIVTAILPVRFVEVSQLVKDLTPLTSTATTMTADEAGNSIVITDSQANIRKVAEIIHAIDSGAEDFTEVRLFRLTNADPTETADLLTNLFPDDSSRQGNSQSPLSMNPFFSRFASRFGGGGGGPGGGPGGGGSPGGSSGGSGNQNQRIKKRNRVIAVADQRTAAIVVSASKDLMEQIAEVITGLDGDPKGKQTVTVVTPQTMDPEELRQVMTDLFNKAGTGNNNRSTSSQNNPLSNRSSSQSQQPGASGSRSGVSSGSRGPGGGGTTFP